MAAVYKSLSKGATSNKAEAASNGIRKQKQRVLILSSRGVTYRHRHLLNDLAALLPHSKKDAKFDAKSKLHELASLADLYNCNNVLFFEARKHQDLYVWLSKVPNGPTVKMHLQNLHTMEELNFVGNCLKVTYFYEKEVDTGLHIYMQGSRPILSFDAEFEKQPYLIVIKELFLHIFGVPPAARRSKPFIDGKIWVRNYEIKEVEPSKAKSGEDGETEAAVPSKSSSKDKDVNLLEIGPRFVLTPIVIQEGCFGGPIIYENREFVSPNQVRADLRRQKASKHNARAEQFVERLSKKGDLGLRTDGGRKAEVDALDKKQLFS